MQHSKCQQIQKPYPHKNCLKCVKALLNTLYKRWEREAKAKDKPAHQTGRGGQRGRKSGKTDADEMILKTLKITRELRGGRNGEAMNVINQRANNKNDESYCQVPFLYCIIFLL